MIRILPIILFLAVITVDSFAQTQLDIQGSETSNDTVARITINYEEPFIRTIGLQIEAVTSSTNNVGISLNSSGTGMLINADARGVSAISTSDYGLFASTSSSLNAAVYGTSNSSGGGIHGFSTIGNGAFGESFDGFGVYGLSDNNYGLYAESLNNYGAYIKGSTGNLLLAATDFGNGDDSVIRTQEDLTDGDLYLISNDATVIRLDEDKNSDGEFLIQNDGNVDVFEMRENGRMVVRSETGMVRLEVEADGDVLVGGAMVLTSDRNKKEEIVDIDQNNLLESLKKLPIYEWQYKGKERRHIGPMAQDFYAAFGLGDDDKTIATIDADGIALAAIQAQQELIDHQSKRIEEQAKQIADQSAKIEGLINRLDQLEKQLPGGDASN